MLQPSGVVEVESCSGDEKVPEVGVAVVVGMPCASCVCVGLVRCVSCRYQVVNYHHGVHLISLIGDGVAAAVCMSSMAECLWFHRLTPLR